MVIEKWHQEIDEYTRTLNWAGQSPNREDMPKRNASYCASTSGVMMGYLGLGGAYLSVIRRNQN